MLKKSEKLTAEELAVLQNRYGLDLSAGAPASSDPLQMDEIEASALRKLRHVTLEELLDWRQAV